MKKELIKRICFGFACSSAISTIIYLILNIIIGQIAGVKEFSSISQAYVALFPNKEMALYTDVILHGILGAAFSGMTIIYENNKIGFIMQNVIYFFGTMIFWLPIIMLIWQLYKIIPALISTICGFAVTYVIVSTIAYKEAKKNIEQINKALEEEKYVES